MDLLLFHFGEACRSRTGDSRLSRRQPGILPCQETGKAELDDGIRLEEERTIANDDALGYRNRLFARRARAAILCISQGERNGQRVAARITPRAKRLSADGYDAPHEVPLTAVEMTGGGSRMESRPRIEDWQRLSAIPVFHRLPPPLETWQMRRAFHIPTAPAVALMSTYYKDVL